MYGISWQNLLMMNATIPPVSEGGGEGKSGGGSDNGEGMDMWDIMQRMQQGKGV